MKKGIIYGLSALLILSLAACSSSSATPSTPSAAQNAQQSVGSAESKSLDMFWFSDGVEGEVAQAIINEYQVANPHITINLIEVPYNDMANKIMMSVSGGEAPALARTTESILSQVFEATLDLGEYGDKEQMVAPFMPSLQNYFIINDKVCALPTDVTANGMFYNKTAFDKAGVAVPTSPDDIWTWDEFIASVKTVMEKGDVRFGLVIDNPTHRWSTMLYEFGGRFMSPEGPAFNSPEGIAAVQFTKSLFDEEIVPASTWLGGEDPNNMFRSGQVAVHLAGNWMITNYRDNIKDFEWGVTYLPTQANRSSVPGGKQIAAFAGSGAEQEAVDFINYFTSQEVNARYCIDATFLSPRLDNANIEHSFGKEYFAIFADELANTVPAASYDWGYPTLAGQIRTPLMEGIAAVLGGSMTAEDHVANIDKISQEIYNEQNNG